MNSPIKSAFEFETVKLKTSELLPTKKLPPGVKSRSSYQTITSSVAEVGVIEPVVVCRQRRGMYLLLDGHMRLEVLKELGVGEVMCLVSTDDEAFTYNSRVSGLAPTQANRMVLKALEAGVSEQRLAKALNLAAKTVRMSRELLRGICPEAIEQLKDKPVSTGALHKGSSALQVLKKVKPLRQIKMADLMIGSANYSRPNALALLDRTPRASLVDPEKSRSADDAKPEDIARMEAEVQALERDFMSLEDSYGRNVVNLTLARGYLKRLLESARIVRYLASKHRDLLGEFQRIQEITSLEG